MSNKVSSITINRLKAGKVEVIRDVVVREIPLAIYCNNVEIATLLCTPEHEKELAVGFLFSAGLLEENTVIDSVTYNEELNTVFVKCADYNNSEGYSFLRKYITSGCGLGTMLGDVEDISSMTAIESSAKIALEDVFGLVKNLQQQSQLYAETGGVHSAALSDGKEIIVFREDIGRHNAIDKIVGHTIFKKIPLKDKIIVTSGRVSCEIVLKLSKAGIGGIISRSAPTEKAVDFAHHLNMLLIGFVRGNKMNIYTGTEKIVGLL